MTIAWGKKRLLLLPASSVGSSDQGVGLVLCCSFQSLEGWSFGAVGAISWSQARSTSCVIVNEVRTEATCKGKVSYHPVTGQWGGGSYFLPSLPLSLYTRTLSCQCTHREKQQKPGQKANYTALLQMLREKESFTHRLLGRCRGIPGGGLSV